MKQKWKRPLALLLSVAMMFSISGIPVYAADVETGATAVCPHHVHDETCGYSEGTPCTHEHTDDCYTLVTQCVHEHTAECYSDGILPAEGEEKAADACTHVCSEESGCITKELNCPHVHDETCGYSEGSPCTFDPSDCELCSPTDSGEPEAPAECTCETLCTADSVNPDCPVCAQDIAACQGETPAPEEARHWQFEENPDGFLIVEENGVFYADAPGGNIPLEAVVSLLPQSLTVEGEANGEPVTVAISGWECPEYQCVEDSWPQDGSYTFTAQVGTDLQLNPAPAVTLRLTNMVQTLATVNNPVLNLADGSIWITPDVYYQYKSYEHTTVSSVPYTGTITITGSNPYGFSCVTITGSGTYDIVLQDAQLNPWYASSEPTLSPTNGLLITDSAQVTLTLEGTSSVTGTRTADEYSAMDGILVTENSSLTIQGSGTLNAYGGDSARKLHTNAESGDGLYIMDSSVTITGDAKVNLYGGHYSDYDPKYITVVGQGCTLIESTLTLEGNVQVTAQGIVAFTQGRDDSCIYVEGGRHAFTGLCLVVANIGDTPLLEIQGGTVDLHLLGTDKDLSGVVSQFSYNGGIAVKGGDVTFRREDCDFRTSDIQVGAQACIFEGSSTDSASFTKKTTGTSYPSLSAKYTRILFDDTSYTLTVESDGTGSSGTGSYTPGTEVPLNAGTKEGYALRRWTLTNGKGLLRSPTSADATFVMYDSDATVKAEFDKLYGLNVEGGSITNPAGQSQFLSGTQVTLQADEPSETMVFDQWAIESGSGSFGDAESAATTFTTGEADTQIKANFVQGYDLTVVNGTGSGLYKPGAQVAIQAEIREGVEFSHWDMTGNVQIADVNAASTTVTMGSEDTTVTAVYQESGVLGDFVVTGTDDGYSFSGDILDISGNGEYTVRMKSGITQTKDRIRIQSGSPTITITDLNLTNNLPFEIQDGNVTLKLDGANTFSTSHSDYAALQKGESGTLTITSVQGDGSTYGSLTIRSGKTGAGIGGRGSYEYDKTAKDPADSANITINGGTLNITTQSGAGIGGGGSSHATYLNGKISGGNGSNITINGGDITIHKGSSPAGIGGGGNIRSGTSAGKGGDGSNITINGGKLLIVSPVNRSYRCGSALGAGKNENIGDTYGSFSDIFVKGSPTVFNLWAMDGSKEVDYLDQRGSDGRVETITDFKDKGCARIEYGGATATSVKIQPADAVVVLGASQRFTATVVASGSWTLDWTVSGNLSNETTITKGGLLTVGANETAKSLTVTATISGTSVSDSVTVTISKGAHAMVTKAPAAVTGLTYTSEAQNLVAAGEAEGGTLVYSLEIDGNYDAAIPTGTNAGSYTVFYYVKGDAKHDDTAKEQVEVTINKAKPTVSDVAVSSPNTIYSDTKLSAITLTHTGTPGTVALDADQTLSVGEDSYNWIFIPNDGNNYETTTGSIRLTVYEPPQEVDGVYQIDSVTDLFWFAGLVNGTLEDVEQDTAASAVLTANIDLSGETWTPIGNYDQSSRDENKYAGTFDGAGHTIDGLKIESSADWQGFVGYLGEGGVIKNLTLGETCSVTGGDYVGSICGYTNGGTIESCTNAGTVTGQSDVGGICGLSRGTVTGCTNEGTVTGSGRWVGGVCGLGRGTVTGCTNEGTVSGSNNVGGVCGTNTGGTTENCANFGAVNGSGEWVGGVCGGNTGTITGCTNSGAVTGNGENVGGIVGYTEDGAIENCQNSGSITGGKYTGAICGWNNAGTITGCTNEGAVNGSGDLGGICGHNEGTVKNCTNSGAVNNGDKNTVGGICGYSKTDVTGCTNSGAVTGKTYVGGIVGYTDDGAVETCQNSGSITGNGEDVGGICGFSNQPITNCANTGDITGGSVVGGVCGLMVSSKVTISNCYNTGTVTGSAVGAVYGKNGRGQSGDGQGTITNCYYQSEETTSTQEGATPKTADQFSSGEVCWLLNGSTSEGTLAWYQNLDNDQDKDTYPVLDSSHGIVYRIEEDPVRYSNDPNGKPAQIISVDITWGDLSFTYSDGTWNPDTHEYDGAGWNVDEEGGNSIKVENTGNTDVNVTYDYKVVENGITGSFTDGENPVSEPVSLPENGSSTVYLILAGKPEQNLDHAKIGSVTVTIGGENE